MEIEPPDLLEQDEEELPDELELVLDVNEPFVVVAADGLPDPLADVAEMLPGGRATRGRPDLVFVETLLDRALAPSLRERPPTLVVLSGNAGDGKTTFLAELIRISGGTYIAGVKNEYDLEIGENLPYRVVLDGSEDAEDRTNDALLDDALSTFKGPAATAAATRGTLIAINKGRLLKFLQERRADYAFLWEVVTAAFLAEGEVPSHPYLLLDLNDRTFVGPSFAASLMIKVINRLISWHGWQGCSTCPAVTLCPAIANVRLLAESGPAADVSPAYKLWRVFAAADFDDRVHITARHVVTQIARLVGSGRRCPDIRAQVHREEPFAASSYLYNAAFDARGSRALGDSSVLDEVLATYDPSERDHPIRGRRLHASVATPDLDALLGPDTEGYINTEAELLAEARIDEEPARGTADYRQRTIALTRAIERKLHFAEATELAPTFLLERFDAFMAETNAEGQVSPATMIANLNAALGVEDGSLGGLLSPRDYTRGLRGRGFAMLIPSGSFEVIPGTALGVPFKKSDFLEGWPRSLLLRSFDRDSPLAGPVAVLAVPLLLYEILGRAGRGFRPASQIERAYMVRLRGFYRQLSEHRWSKQPQYVLYDNGRIVGKAKITGSSFSLMRL